MEKKAKILVVDDEGSNVRLLEALLAPKNYQVSTALSGEEALERIAADSPDLVLLDVMMPRTNGFEVCARLKGQTATAGIPVIFLTSKTDTESIVQGFEAGGHDYITKPFNKAELLARVSTQVELKQSRDALEKRTVELERANARLRELDQLKSDFLNMAAHDIRTPITSIVGFAKIIRKRIVSMQQPETDPAHREKHSRQIREDVDIIIGEGERLTTLINDLLDLAKLEAGKVILDVEPFPVRQLFDQTLAPMALFFEKKNLRVVQEIEAGAAEIYVDRNRLLQVMANLVSNAVKFTPENGTITCRARNGRGPDACFVEISIQDTGIGIAKEELGKVFEKFHQIYTRNDGMKGTGLGLPICKMIVELQGGRMWLESEPGQGCTFTFTVPAHQAGS